jgi:outer membrane protein OmpA-like peptidoglycan-associated protein
MVISVRYDLCLKAKPYPIINAKQNKMKRKKILLLTVFLAIAATVFSQTNRVSGGIVAGANYSYINTSDEITGINYDWKWKFGPAGGIYLNISFGNTVSLQPSLLYSQMGARYYTTDNTGTFKWTQNLGYLSVPVPLKINAGNSVAFLVGPQVDFLVGASVKDASGNKVKNEDDFDQVDIAGTGGIQIAPNAPVSLTVRYIHGFKNLMNNASAPSAPNEVSSTVTNAHNSGVQATLNFRLFGGKQKAVAVTTPEVPVLVDTDGDGVYDNVDKCPNTPGVAKYDGCPVPDSDNDGVNDDEDKCPTVAGSAKYNGCPVPDSDNDGINDDNDKCPSVPGVERHQGCPVPDSDNDGINDEEDNCPGVAGTAANHGCPSIDASTQSKVDMMTKGISWTPASSYILSTTSKKALDQVANMLKADANLKATISVHTTTADKDKSLSQNRADAIKEYLMSQDVKESQLEATGYGGEQPIGTGAKNQRTEISLHY